MIYQATYYQIKYPRQYTAGMGYKKITLGKAWITDCRKRLIGIENALWQGAARLRVTDRVNAFDLIEAYGPNAGEIYFCGNLP